MTQHKKSFRNKSNHRKRKTFRKSSKVGGNTKKQKLYEDFKKNFDKLEKIKMSIHSYYDIIKTENPTLFQLLKTAVLNHNATPNEITNSKITVIIYPPNGLTLHLQYTGKKMNNDSSTRNDVPVLNGEKCVFLFKTNISGYLSKALPYDDDTSHEPDSSLGSNIDYDSN